MDATCFINTSEKKRDLHIHNMRDLESIKSVEGPLSIFCKNCPSLQTIEIPRLRVLNLVSCSMIKEVPMISGLEELYCEHCVDIKEIPLIPSLKKLNCKSLMSLKKVEISPNVTEFYCDSCSLNQVPMFPKLEKLSLKRCQNIFSLPVRLRMREVFLDQMCGISIIPEMKHVEKLCIDSLVNLTNIRSQPSLKKLIVLRCNQLTSLPNNLDSLTSLDYGSGCNIDDIPSYPKLRVLKLHNTRIGVLKVPKSVEHVKCYDNHYLTEIKTFMNSKLEYLICAGNRNLSRISFCYNLKNLDCSRTKIKEIYPFPNLETLSCNDCPKLKRIPAFPNLKNLDCYDCYELDDIAEMDSLQVLMCDCSWMERIKCGKNLVILSCRYCPKLKEIDTGEGKDEAENIHAIACTNCNSLERIEGKRQIHKLGCDNSRLLIKIPPKSEEGVIVGSGPWLETNFNYEQNIQSLIKLQKWFRRRIKASAMEKWKIDGFNEWWYHPESPGGKMAVKRLTRKKGMKV